MTLLRCTKPKRQEGSYLEDAKRDEIEEKDASKTHAKKTPQRAGQKKVNFTSESNLLEVREFTPDKDLQLDDTIELEVVYQHDGKEIYHYSYIERDSMIVSASNQLYA